MPETISPDALLAQQLELLEIERKEDLHQYNERVKRRSLKVRVEKGISWFPVEVKQSYLGTGERVVVELERQGEADAPNVIQSGSVVFLFGVEGDKEIGQVTGTVYTVRRNKMRIVLGGSKFPYWLNLGKIGVNLGFDDRTYRDMHKALQSVRDARGNRLAELRRILLGEAAPEFFRGWEYEYGNPQLNRSQEQAVQRVLQAKDIALIHGPPGTGKTTTLVQAIVETCKREQQVLVCAPSNTATDLLTLRCAEQGLDVVRIGNPARIEEELHIHTLDETLARHVDYEDLRKMRKEAEQLYRRVAQHKARYGRRNRQHRREMQREASSLKKYAHALEEYILQDVLATAQVICATLTGVAGSVLKGKRFTSLFVDEAAQALAPANWIAIARAERVIFAGDHQQLPPTVKSYEAEQAGLGVTLFEQAIARHPEAATLLEVQYRMHQQIMGFSNQQFYEGRLRAAEEVRYWNLGPDHPPLEFIDTAGCGFDEQKNSELSTYNPEEAELLLRHLAATLDRLQRERPERFAEETSFSVGVLAPYKAQVQTLRDQFNDSPMLSSFAHVVTIDTVDGFQGQERDMMYISLTRSNKKQEIGFLKDTRRMNVALTRARQKLVVVGNSATLGAHPFFQNFIEYAETRDAYRTAWEVPMQ